MVIGKLWLGLGLWFVSRSVKDYHQLLCLPSAELFWIVSNRKKYLETMLNELVAADGLGLVLEAESFRWTSP